MNDSQALELIKVLKEISSHLASIDEKLDNLGDLSDLGNIHHAVVDLPHYIER